VCGGGPIAAHSSSTYLVKILHSLFICEVRYGSSCPVILREA
jgi:hypothetical protein